MPGIGYHPRVPARKRSSATGPSPDLSVMTDEQLLDTRICDLPVCVDGSELRVRVDQIYDELERAGIRLRPKVWLSDEWFCPNAFPGIAIPPVRGTGKACNDRALGLSNTWSTFFSVRSHDSMHDKPNATKGATIRLSFICVQKNSRHYS